MQHFYVPCSQQDNQQGFSQQQPQTFQSAFRRPSNQFSKDAGRYTSKGGSCPKSTNGRRPEHYEHCSSASPPSLGSSSPSSLEDETSPKTPGSDYNKRRSTEQFVEQVKSGLDLSSLGQVAAWETCSKSIVPPFANQTRIAQALPSRVKRSDAIAGEGQATRITGAPDCSFDVAPPVIQETVVRSRLARDVKRDAGDAPQICNEVSTNVPNPVVTFNSRCHARRRPCADTRTLAPPKLQRDTDCTDAIVRRIVCLSTKLVHAIWSQSAATPKTSSSFNGAGVLPLKVFIQETLRRSKTSYSTLQVTLYYLILLKPHVNFYHDAQEQRVPMCRALQCGRRMFLTALILASKYLQDRNYSSRAWSKISGLPIAEINENERRYLNLIQFNLHMKKESFENWSKITLSLCNIGEASLMDAAPVMSDAAGIGSDGWWTYQLRRLTAELVHDSEQTVIYLASLTIDKAGNHVSSEQLIASLDTPPSSPESTDEGVTENILMKMLSRGSTESYASSDFANLSSSPAIVSDLPSRPNLPNLPTPSTTPRYNNVLPWPRGPCQSNIRCQASSQALLNLDRQAMNVANLETCPPPKPRPCDLPRSMSYPTKRAPSSLGTALVTTSLTCSPESTVSDCTTRSRSSSISSNSSVWFASGKQDCNLDSVATCPVSASREGLTKSVSAPAAPASYNFYHPTDRAQFRFEDEGIVISNCAPRIPQPLTTGQGKFLDEGYGSDGRSEIDKILTQQRIASVLASMDTSRGWSNRPAAAIRQTSMLGPDQVPQKRHKRAHSSTVESSLHDEVRQLMWSSQPSTEVIDTPIPMPKMAKDKEVQYPEREWADLKRPVPNNMYNKRIALQHHNDVAANATAELAAACLRDIAMAN